METIGRVTGKVVIKVESEAEVEIDRGRCANGGRDGGAEKI